MTNSGLRITRREMRHQVAAYLDSIEVGRYDADGAFQALVARFGVTTPDRIESRDEFWPIIRRFDLAP